MTDGSADIETPLDLMQAEAAELPIPADLALTPEQIAELEQEDPETLALIKSIEEEARVAMDNGGNPLAGESVPQLIKIYLDNSKFGTRWVVEKATEKLRMKNRKAKYVSRKGLVKFMQGDEDALTADEVSAVIDVILDDHRKMKVPVVPAAPSEAVPQLITPTIPLSRNQRRLAKRKEKVPYARGQTPYVQHYDELGVIPETTPSEE